jgi:hypothetical protein
LSNIFEGLLYWTTGDALPNALVDASINCRIPFSVVTLTEEVSAAVVVGPDHLDTFPGKLECAATALAKSFGQVLLVRYDDQIGHRSSALYESGREKVAYGEEDEIWVLLDDDGAPDMSGPRLRVDQLDPDPDVEYETIENAIQLGLRDFGWERWRLLHHFIGSGQVLKEE